MKRLIKNLLGGGDKLTYEKAKELASHEAEDVRVELAGRDDLRPELLYFLAADESPAVRRTIARNDATPAPADLLLATDGDDGVRGELAQKIARIAPQLTASDQDKLKRMAYESLETLAMDQVVRVRMILAEALKDVAGAPPEVIRRLAFDTEIDVAGPILQFSPVLTDADLIEIIDEGSLPGRFSAICRRRHIGEPVSEAIIATAEEEAVAMLLANPSAQIREETLNTIIDRAAEIESWHAPLVARPKLSAAAATSLAGFVAANLLQILASRSEFDDDVLERVRAVVERRIEGGDAEVAKILTVEAEKSPAEIAYEHAETLEADGTLDLAAFMAGLGAKDEIFISAYLAVKAGLTMGAMQKAFAKQNIKGVVAVCWKSGLTAELAEKVQMQMLGLPESDIVSADADKNYAMSEGDMEWQLELLSGAA